MNRYDRFDANADAGLGADEFDGPRRFTRSSDWIEPGEALDPVDSHLEMGDPAGQDLDAIDAGRVADQHFDSATQELLDAAADRLWTRMQEAGRDHPQHTEFRRRAFEAKDKADEFRRSHENGPGSAATDSEAKVSNPHQEKEN